MTEVGMVESCPGSWPVGWPTPDGRDGGVPDPALRGPAMIQIGTEGGVLPAPAVIPNRPVGYEYGRRSITVLNVLEKALFLAPAERADVVVDFTPFAGKTVASCTTTPRRRCLPSIHASTTTRATPTRPTRAARRRPCPATAPTPAPSCRSRWLGAVGATPPVDYVNPTMKANLDAVIPAAFRVVARDDHRAAGALQCRLHPPARLPG